MAEEVVSQTSAINLPPTALKKINKRGDILTGKGKSCPCV
jgi:hypothetical protein